MLLLVVVCMSIAHCVKAFPQIEVEKQPFKAVADYKTFERIHLRKKRSYSERAAYNRCYSPTYNAIYPYRNYPFYYPGSEYYSGPYLERPFARGAGRFYECPFASCLHRNTGYLEALFNRKATTSQMGQQFPPL
ncbi:hypothetical protein D918_06190 [Trichuris suis]|nr:hypothetical protein D918_06190 [Trichuris suis]